MSNSRLVRGVLVLLWGVGVAGCDGPQPKAQTEPAGPTLREAPEKGSEKAPTAQKPAPAVAPTSGRLDKDNSASKPQSPWSQGVPLRGWIPDQDEDIFAELRWARSGKVALWSAPSPKGEQTGHLTAKKGQRVSFEESHVLVTKPLVYLALADTTLRSVASVNSNTLKIHGESHDLRVAKDERVYLIQYGGEGEVILGVRGGLYNYSYSQMEGFRCLCKQDATPEQRWWVRLQRPTGGGWVEVEDRTIRVKMRGPGPP